MPKGEQIFKEQQEQSATQSARQQMRALEAYEPPDDVCDVEEWNAKRKKKKKGKLFRKRR